MAATIDPLGLFLEQADALAVGLRLLRDRLSLALGRTFAVLSEGQGWKLLGYARQSDYAREKLGRSSRWVREMTRLGEAVERCPRLALALTGEDGGIPLGVSALLEIAAVAEQECALAEEARSGRPRRGRRRERRGYRPDGETEPPPVDAAWLEMWIDRARSNCLRTLRVDAAAARADAHREHPPLSRKALCLGLEEVSRETGASRHSEPRNDEPRNGQPRNEQPRNEQPGNDEPRDDATGRNHTTDREAEENRPLEVKVAVPPEAAAAFEEVLDLHRAVCGGHASIASFVEALVAEHRAGPGNDALLEDTSQSAGRESAVGDGHNEESPEEEIKTDAQSGIGEGIGEGIDEGTEQQEAAWVRRQRQARERAAEREQRLAESCGHWKQWPQRGEEIREKIAAHQQARALLSEIGRLVEQATGSGRAFETDAAALHRRVRRLMAADRRIEITLGRLLATMADRRAWSRLHPPPWRFETIAHYAEERLGISRTRAWQLVRVARRLRHFPRLRRAYGSGRASLEAVLLVLGVLGNSPVEEGIERLWTDRACRSTIKRLRDEVRELKRRRVREPTGAPPPAPLTDDAWYHAKARPRGRSYRRVERFWKEAERTHARRHLLLRKLYFYLHEDLAEDFLTTLRAAARRAATDPRLAQDAGPGPVQTFSVPEGRPQLWRGLMVLLMDYCETWDPPDVPRSIAPRRPNEKIFVRDGYRCTAPGCTSRRHLEDHHVRYRSRGGSDDPANRITLCRFHHQRGQHGGLMRVTGSAPTGLHFRLGQPDADADSYLNELRADPTS